MELVGEEKKIQALFSEARLADAVTTPTFARVWNRAEAQRYRPRKAFNLAFAGATALLVCALVSLAWWSTRSPKNHDIVATAPPVTVPVTPAQPQQNGAGSAVKPRSLVPGRLVSTARSNAIRLAARREAILLAANMKAAQEAKAIASWKSPTATLLDSPSDDLIKSLPQMNQTVNEMKSFLPSQPK